MPKILDVRIDSLTIEEALQRIEGFLKDNQPHYIVTPNPEFLVRAQEDEEFKEILNQADLAVPDGVGLILAARFLGQPFKQRITGTDLMEKICQRAVQKKWRVFLFGGEKGAAEKAADNLKNKYPGLEIQPKDALIGTVPPSLGTVPKFRGTVPTNASLGRSSILFVALGAPKQEKWIVDNLEKMPWVKVAMGVGGAFDFISGRVQRAPLFLQRLGLEWFWRLFCQPWRSRRIFNAVIKFPYLVIKSTKKEQND